MPCTPNAKDLPKKRQYFYGCGERERERIKETQSNGEEMISLRLHLQINETWHNVIIFSFK